MALRTFADCVNSNDHAFGMNPADYTLVELGEFDISTGKLMPYEVAKTLGTGIEFVRQVDPRNLTGDLVNAVRKQVSNDTPLQPSTGGGNST